MRIMHTRACAHGLASVGGGGANGVNLRVPTPCICCICCICCVSRLASRVSRLASRVVSRLSSRVRRRRGDRSAARVDEVLRAQGDAPALLRRVREEVRPRCNGCNVMQCNIMYYNGMPCVARGRSSLPHHHAEQQITTASAPPHASALHPPLRRGTDRPLS